MAQTLQLKLIPGALVIYLSISRHRDLNLCRYLQKLSMQFKLELSPQAPPDLPPTGRWKVKTRRGASEPLFHFSGSCPYFCLFFSKLIFTMIHLYLDSQLQILETEVFKVLEKISEKLESTYFQKILFFIDWQSMLSVDAAGRQLNDQLFWTATLYQPSSLYTQKKVKET